MAKSKGSGNRDKWLFLIGVAKCAKGAILLLLALGALKLFQNDTASAINRWVGILNVDPDNHYLAALIKKLGRLQEHQKLLLAAGTFVYSALFLTEGIGLLLKQHWAEYFTVLVTGSFLPLEIYELIKHFSAAKVVVILLNAAIVAYLVWKLRHEKKHRLHQG